MVDCRNCDFNKNTARRKQNKTKQESQNETSYQNWTKTKSLTYEYKPYVINM